MREKPGSQCLQEDSHENRQGSKFRRAMIDLTTNPGTYENRALLFENNLFDSSLMHQKCLLGVVARPRNQSSTLVADSFRIAR
jgi:hypothetical protein